jgi:hypothetical protein
MDQILGIGHGGFDPGQARSRFHVYPIVYSIGSGYRPSFTPDYYLEMGDIPSLWVSHAHHLAHEVGLSMKLASPCSGRASLGLLQLVGSSFLL